MNDGKKITSTSSNEAVSINDVRTVLQETTNDLASLCRSSKINMWARFKPIAINVQSLFNLPTPITYKTRKDNKFGIVLPNGYYNLNDAYEETIINNGWTYSKPGNGLYCRLTDFLCYNDNSGDLELTPYLERHVGYNHDASIPFITEILETNAISWQLSIYNSIPYFLVNTTSLTNGLTIKFKNTDGYDLHLLDFFDLTKEYNSLIGWRPLIQIYEHTGNTWYNGSDKYSYVGDIITNDTILWNVTIPTSDLASLIGQNNTRINYHMCFGIACCDDSIQSFGENYVYPVPFGGHYMFEPMSGNTHMSFVLVNGIKYVDGSGHLTETMPTIPMNTSGKFVLDVKITNYENYQLNLGSSLPQVLKLYIAYQDNINNKYELSPCNINMTNQSYSIPAGSEENPSVVDNVLLQLPNYSDMSLGDIPNGGTGRYIMFSKIGDGDISEVSSFTISKSNN